MKVLIYESLPVHGAEIRKTVFMLEQGFQNEFDEIDDRAVHFVLFHENDIPAAACRVFWDAEMDSYILGRLAVLKQFRGQNIGAAIVEKAENYVRSRAEESFLCTPSAVFPVFIKSWVSRNSVR